MSFSDAYQRYGYAVCSHMLSLRLARAADLDQQPIRPVRARYADLFKACRIDGCNEPPEDGSEDCYRHTLVDAF